MLFQLIVRRIVLLTEYRKLHFIFYLDQEDFTSESIELVKSSILGSTFKAMITGYHYDNTPFIQLSRRNDFVKILYKKKYSNLIVRFFLC